MNQLSAIQSGDIIREAWIPPEELPLLLYQGSGRSGACWNSWGLMNSEAFDQSHPDKNKSLWSHADHWFRGGYDCDAWLPVGRLIWAENEPAMPRRYEQKLTLLDGRLRTRVENGDGCYSFCSSFDPGRPDILTFEIEYDFPGGTLPPLLFQSIPSVDAGYIGVAKIGVRSLVEQERLRVLEADSGTVRTHVGIGVLQLDGASCLKSAAEGVRLEFAGSRGKLVLQLGAANETRAAKMLDELRTFSREQSAAHWKARWGSAWIHIPDRAKQALWARSHYYILCSYGADVRTAAPPMGWTGNNWPYAFPQDLSYLHPALLRLGHLDIAKAWIESYQRTIPSMQETTRRMFKGDGVMWAWSYPIGETSHLMPDGAPHIYAYQIHNAAYPARMAFETARHVGDRQWSETIAWPVVRESARFYASLVRRGSDGLWDLQVDPSSGQDEFDEGTHHNYLCSLFSARYALQAALALAETLRLEDKETTYWRNILADGLATPRLLDPGTGVYATAEDIDMATRWGKQKHPVQINPLVFLPLGRPDQPTLNAYRLRHEICIGHETRTYAGWTLPAFWLAAAHLGDAGGLLGDLELGIPTRNIDADSIQFYESANGHCPYFITTSGLYCQALQDALVHDYWGPNEFGTACPAEWTDVAFGGLRTSDRRIWAGVKNSAGWHIQPQNES